MEERPAVKPKGKTVAAPPKPNRQREERAERAPRRADAQEKKSRLPIFIGAGVVVVGAIVAIMLSSGGGGGPGGTKGTTALDWWAKEQPRLATASADELRAILAEGRAKYGNDAAFWNEKQAQVEAALLKKDPSDASANERVGNRNLRDYPDFDKVYARMLENFKRLPDEMKAFAESLELPEGKPGEPKQPYWLPPAKYDEVV